MQQWFSANCSTFRTRCILRILGKTCFRTSAVPCPLFCVQISVTSIYPSTAFIWCVGLRIRPTMGVSENQAEGVPSWTDCANVAWRVPYKAFLLQNDIFNKMIIYWTSIENCVNIQALIYGSIQVSAERVKLSGKCQLMKNCVALLYVGVCDFDPCSTQPGWVRLKKNLSACKIITAAAPPTSAVDCTFNSERFSIRLIM